MRSTQHLFAAATLASAVVGCTTTPTDTDPTEPFTCDGDVCTLTGPVLSDLTLTADKQWLLSGGVFVGDDADPDGSPAILTIEPGTTIFGDTSVLSFLLITRGSQLQAEGTADAPIVFTSARAEGSRARGDWGGVVLNGQAPVNGCSGDPCVLQGEAGTGTYGGAVANDNSGTLRFVRIEFSGALIDDENEFNGLALQGVGSGTEISDIHVHRTADDCVEFFGGTAQMKRVVCTGAGDDNLDWTFGWTGKVQFLVAQQYADAGERGIEADNNEANNELTPVANPEISNITLIGQNPASKDGILLRRGSQGRISNAIVTGFAGTCFNLDDDATFAGAVSGDALTGDTTIKNSLFDCTNLTDDADGDAFLVSDFVMSLNSGNQIADASLTAATSTDAPDFAPAAGSLALGAGDAPSDAFFDDVDFIGAVGPDDNWTSWTTFPAK